MGRVENRLEYLESVFQPEPDAIECEVFERSLKRLSLVELHVLTELLEIKQANPDLDDAKLWKIHTPLQRTMAGEWRKLTHQIRKEIEKERREELG